MKEKHKDEHKKTGNTSAISSTGKIWLIVFVAALAMICVLVAAVIWDNGQAAKTVPQPTLEAAKTTPQPSQNVSASSTPMALHMLPAMEKLYQQNSDIVGWITIEGTEVDYPVMYTPQDGEYYLYRNFEQEEDPTKQGCIFIDKHCTVEPRGTNLLLHGHNMKNGTMFHTLIDYKNEDFYQEHKTIHFDTLYKEEEYEIVSVFLTKIYNKSDTDVFKFYQFYDAKNEKEFNAFIQNCKELAIYETGITPVYGDELITLSTCEYSIDNGRIVVVARQPANSEDVIASGEVAV
ncbi:MAG: class B sortase [Christensenella sp.]|nr:class B sortase [Christensenella sp.]